VSKIAYFVMGPESSGTRMMTQAFLSFGFHGDGGHRQKLDKTGFAGGHETIVFRRSIPHGKVWPPIAKLIKRMEKNGYTVRPVVIVRDKDVCAKSQVKNHHVKDEKQSRQHISRAWAHMFLGLAQAGHTPHVIYYEAFVKFKKVRTAFFKQFGLAHPKMDFYNADLQYDKKKKKPKK
jgi:hypothetical protein